MRPIKLTISAFGPYADLTVLNLDKLGENGLYLITGTTGAGKTSIFDAIAYALYGTPSGSSRKDSMLRSKYANTSTDTFVELTFVCNGKTYTVRRNPSYERPKLRGEGTTKQTAKAELHYPDGRIVDKSEKEVTDAVSEVIGIDRNQFLQIAMIAQGDFLKLLHAKTEDRKAIFRQIFKTQKFEKIQYKLKEEAQRLRAQYDDARKSLLTYAQGIACDPENLHHSEVMLAKSNQIPTTRTIELLTQLITEDTEAQANLNNTVQAISKDLEIVNANIGKAEEYAQNVKTFEQKQQELPQKAGAFADAKERLETEKAKQPEREQLDKKMTTLEGELAQYDAADKLANEIAMLAASIQTAQTKQNEMQTLLGSREAEIKQSRETIKSLSDADSKKEKLEAEKEKINGQEEKIKVLQKSLKEFESLCKDYADKQAEYQALMDAAQKASELYNTKNKAFLDEQAGVLASKLEEGTPCPVCGSTHHPILAAISENAPTEAELKSAQKAAEDAQKRAEQKSVECGSLKGKVETLEKNLQAQIVESLGDCGLQNAAQCIGEKLCETQSLSATLALQIQTEKGRIQEREKLEKEIPIQEKMLEKLREDAHCYAQSYATDVATKAAKEEQLATLCKDLHFASRADAQKELQTLSTQKAALQKALEDATQSFNNCDKELSALRGELSALQNVVAQVCKIDLEGEKQKRDALNANFQACKRGLEAVVSRLTANQRSLASIEKTAAETQKLEAHYQWMDTLDRTANATLQGKEKIMLETYIQMNYFDRILLRANRRLQKMTNGQYDLIRRHDSSNHQSQAGLDLDVVDHYNGTMRPVNSLSGGESFKASLALALGLSDEIQSSAGGVRLDTMFVDEGFGSLDDDSLRLAIATLQELTDGNRLVGIISHVAELKTKIDKQIIVTKELTGGSSCKIVEV